MIMHVIAMLMVVFAVSVSANEIQDALNALTGNIHTRIVWRVGGHPINTEYEPGTAIQGFDSKTGEITTIWEKPCIRAVIVAGGRKVVASTVDYKTYIMNWDGSDERFLADGIVSDAWQDPDTKEDYAIYRAGGIFFYADWVWVGDGGVYRMNLDDPNDKTCLWPGLEGKEYPWFQLSADGKRAFSFFPWPNGKWLTLPVTDTAATQPIDWGCWSSVASDNSYRWFRLLSSHKDLRTWENDKVVGKEINVVPPGSPSTTQVYCPRTADGPHCGNLFAISGYYPGKNKNGPGVEVFVAAFNDGWTGLKEGSWVRITNNNTSDQHPAMWVGVEDGATGALHSESQSTQAADGCYSIRPGINGTDAGIRIAAPGRHAITIVAPDGRIVKAFNGHGPSYYSWNPGQSGMYIARIQLPGRRVIAKRVISY